MPSQQERLARPFPPKYVKPPAKGKYGSYVPIDVVQQALILILGPPSITIGEIFYGPDNQIEGCLVTLRTSIDGEFVTVTEVGDCENPTNWHTQGARMKDAISDGIKRCAMRLGLGLHLWAQEDYFLYAAIQKQELEKPFSLPASALGEVSAAETAGGVSSPPATPRERADRKVAQLQDKLEASNA